MNNELTDRERELLAEALFSYIAGYGKAPVFGEIVEIAQKIGVMDKFAGIAHTIVAGIDKKMLEENKKEDDKT